jgi:hypothetical protein
MIDTIRCSDVIIEKEKEKHGGYVLVLDFPLPLLPLIVALQTA